MLSKVRFEYNSFIFIYTGKLNIMILHRNERKEEEEEEKNVAFQYYYNQVGKHLQINSF